MNFFKISGIFLGTVSVAGATGTGIYYADNKNKKSTLSNVDNTVGIEKTFKDRSETALVDVNNNIQVNSDGNNDETGKLILKSDKNFVGKIIFYKKIIKSLNYEAKLISATQYQKQQDELNKFNDKKIIDISGNLDSGKARIKLKEIASKSSSFSDIKEKIISEEKDLKSLLGEEIYESLKTELVD